MPLPIQKISSDLSVSLWAKNDFQNETRVLVSLPNILSVGILAASPVGSSQADITIHQLFGLVDATRTTATKVTNRMWYKMGLTASYANGRYALSKDELNVYSKTCTYPGRKENQLSQNL